MCSSPKISAPPPPPAPPPTLEQLAPKAASSETAARKKRMGLSRYKIDATPATTRTNKLGGLPTRTGAGK